MKIQCDNCESNFVHEDELAHVFPDIPGLTKRIAPGETVPVGECPNCGALVHLCTDEVLVCGICGDHVIEIDLREHLREHNPNAEGMEWEDIRNAFREAPSDTSDATSSEGIESTGDKPGFRPLSCPKCGVDGCMAQIDLIPGYARIYGVYEDGTIEWAGETEVDWDMQRSADNPPEFVCLACSSRFTTEELEVGTR